MRVLRIVVVSIAALAALACGLPAFGQAPPPDDLQPGVNTSALPVQPAAAAKGAQGGQSAPGQAARSGTGRGRKSGAKSTAKSTAGTAAAAGTSAKGGKAVDRLDLDTTQITGNKELPKVMYVVPWKRADLGDLTGKPANSLVDEVLQPVDRDVFNREERYYHTVAPQKSPPEPQAGVPAGH